MNSDSVQSKKSVLFIDDEAYDVKPYVDRLQDGNPPTFDVVHVEDIETATTWFSANAEQTLALVLDLMLPWPVAVPGSVSQRFEDMPGLWFFAENVEYLCELRIPVYILSQKKTDDFMALLSHTVLSDTEHRRGFPQRAYKVARKVDMPAKRFPRSLQSLIQTADWS